MNTSAGDVSLFDKNDFNFASGHTNGDLSVQDCTSGPVCVCESDRQRFQGCCECNAKTITLDQSGNDFQAAVTSSSTAGGTTLVDKNDLSLNKADSAGNLNVTAGGNLALGNVSTNGDLNTVAGEALSEIKDSAITVAGSSNLNAKSISLDQSGNDFQSAVTASSTADSTTLVDKNDLVLNTADSAGNLNVTAGGNLALGNLNSTGDMNTIAGEALSEIKDSTITVAGSSKLNAKTITLDQSGNDFQGAVTSSSTTGNTSLTDKNALLLNNVNSQGDLILNSQGDIKQLADSTIQVRGESTLSGNAVGVGEVGNDFGDGLAIHAKGDALISDQNDLLIRGASVGKNLTIQAKNVSQTDAVAVGQSTRIQAQSINLSNLDNQWGSNEVLNSQGDASLAGQNVVLGASKVGGNLQVSSNQVAQTGVLSVNGNTLVQASAGDINLQSANELKGALALSGDQVMLRNTLASHLASLSSKGGKLESDGVLYLEGNVFQGGGDFTFLTRATPAALSSAQIKAMQIPELDAYSGKSAVDPFSGVSDLSIASAGIQQTGGVIQSNAGAHTHFQSTENASIILNRSNQINGLFTALAGSQYGTQYVYSYAKGASLVSVNNLAPLSTDRNGIEADLIAIRSNGLSTLDDSVLRARLPYNDLLVGASQSYPGLLLSIPVDSANRVNNNGLFEFGAHQSGSSTKGAINVEVGNPALPGLGGFTTVLPFQGAVVAPDQLVFLRGPKVSRLYSFYYDGAGNVTRIPVSYNGYIVLSPQESAALTSSQGSVNLARQEQQQSVVRTENVSGQVINGVIMEVGTGRPATEGTGGIAKPATCGSNDADGGC
nr:hypothetical protein [Limnobacter sp.]